VSSVNLELRHGGLQPQRHVDYVALGDEYRLAAYFRRKAILDRILALLLLVPGLPLIGALVLLVRTTSSGPAIFRQVRVGKDGRTFTMYKLRSMTQDAEKKSGPVWATAKDNRVTRVGYVLRKLHLDELPQLFNVLKGEMSLIGPRPERPEFVDILAEQIPDYRERLAILPGVTGLAQINLPPDSTLDDVRRKLVLDLEYIQHAGFWLDVRMLACTMLRMVGTPGALSTRLTGVERQVELPTHPLEFAAAGGDGEEATPIRYAALFAASPAPADEPGANGNGHPNGNGNGASSRERRPAKKLAK
jgi:lipopolysaccharide/colanic/teichoic acid biosynthesis glycosyltransferase